MKQFWILGFMLWALAACNGGHQINTVEPAAPVGRELKMDAAFDCQPDRLFHGIVNGSRVKPRDQVAKKAVLLVINKSYGRVICSGTAISTKTILTAAHCTSGAGKNSIAAVFHPDMKCSSGYSPNQVIKAVDFTVHPDYNRKANAVGDIAVVKLERDVPRSYISELYDGKSELSSDELIMMGYGSSRPNGDDIKVLRKVHKRLSTDAALTDNRIAFDQSKGSGGVCTGDSGGPVYVKTNGSYQVVAVNSIVAGADSDTDPEACNKFSVGMYVPAFLPWIRDQIEIFEGPPK